jgi:hypothetical protein
MNIAKMFLSGLGLGAGAMYLFDPVQGRRRRAVMRDKMIRMCNDCQVGVERGLRDASHRIDGLVAETAAMFRGDHPDDEQLCERVRSKLGRHVTHPRAIEVSAQSGCITLSGPIFRDEVEGLIMAVRGVRGVCDLENRLEPHEHGTSHPSLQGVGKPPGEPFELMQANWTPAARLFVGTLGGVLMFNCLAKRSLGSMLLGTLGFGMFLRSAANQELADVVRGLQWSGRGDGRSQQPGRPPARTVIGHDEAQAFHTERGNVLPTAADYNRPNI